MIAVNAVGDVLSSDGTVLAGVRLPPDGQRFAGTLALLRQAGSQAGSGPLRTSTGSNTVIGVVATNARLDKEQTNKLAQMAQDGLAQAIHPAHTLYDGDTLFALSTGQQTADFSLVSAFAAEVVAEAIRNGVREATSMGGIPAARDVKTS